MQYGFSLPKTTNGADLVAFAKAVEDLGFESVWVGDHVVCGRGDRPVPVHPGRAFRVPT